MPKLKLDDGVFDAEALEEAEEGEQYEDYEGEVPRTNTTLKGRIVGMWATKSEAGNVRFPYLWIAEGNTGDLKQFNGLPVFDGVTWTARAASFYKPFLRAFGLKASTVQTKTTVEEEEGRNGNKITKIGKLVFDRESDDGLCRMIIKREKWEGEYRAKCKKFLPLSAADDAAGDDDDDDAPAGEAF